jgi:shikimate kinase
MLRLSEQPQQRPALRVGRHLSRLILTGFMGAGKSTVGALVAESLGWQFLDLDQVIEATCGQTVSEIFRERGEPYFRAQERESIERMLHSQRVVIALGGGAIEDPITLSSVLNSPETCLVFLDAPMPELLGRLRGSSPTRPLLLKPDDLAARHERRLPHYRAAHLTVVTTGLTPREVASQLLERAEEEWLVEERPKKTNAKPDAKRG